MSAAWFPLCRMRPLIHCLRWHRLDGGIGALRRIVPYFAARPQFCIVRLSTACAACPFVAVLRLRTSAAVLVVVGCASAACGFKRCSCHAAWACFAVSSMDYEFITKLLRTEVASMKSDLQQQHHQFQVLLRQENAEMKQQILSSNHMMMQSHLSHLSEHIVAMDARMKAMQTDITVIKAATPPSTATSSMQTKLTLSSKNSQRGQPEPDGDICDFSADGFSSGVVDWLETASPAWVCAYPAPGVEQQLGSQESFVPHFAHQPAESSAQPSEKDAETTSAQQSANDSLAPVLTAPLTAVNLSAHALLTHNPRVCMLCRRPFRNTRYHITAPVLFASLTFDQAQ